MSKKAGVLTMLGFAKKAGQLVSGESAVKAMYTKGQVYLLILAEDYGDNRKNFWTNIAAQDNIPLFIIGSKLELGLALGLSPRALIGISDRAMAKSIEMKMQ